MCLEKLLIWFLKNLFTRNLLKKDTQQGHCFFELCNTLSTILIQIARCNTVQYNTDFINGDWKYIYQSDISGVRIRDDYFKLPLYFLNVLHFIQ